MIQKELENGIVACGEYKFKKLYSEEEILESIQRIADEMNNVYVPILK